MLGLMMFGVARVALGHPAGGMLLVVIGLAVGSVFFAKLTLSNGSHAGVFFR